MVSVCMQHVLAVCFARELINPVSFPLLAITEPAGADDAGQVPHLGAVGLPRLPKGARATQRARDAAGAPWNLLGPTALSLCA
jgi:hypothetical protein